MAKKTEDYSIDEKDLLAINKGLSKQKEGGGIKFDDLLGVSENHPFLDECPFCHSKSYTKEITVKDADGNKKKASIEVHPFIADREHLVWRTKCCGFSGGISGASANYVMVTKGINVKEATKWLKDFIR